MRVKIRSYLYIVYKVPLGPLTEETKMHLGSVTTSI